MSETNQIECQEIDGNFLELKPRSDGMCLEITVEEGDVTYFFYLSKADAKRLGEHLITLSQE